MQLARANPKFAARTSLLLQLSQGQLAHIFVCHAAACLGTILRFFVRSKDLPGFDPPLVSDSFLYIQKWWVKVLLCCVTSVTTQNQTA